MSLTEQTHFMYEPDVAAQPSICPEYELGRTGPLVREPGPSGPYLSWVEYFILEYGKEIQIHYSPTLELLPDLVTSITQNNIGSL